MTAPTLWTKYRGLALAIAADYHLPGQDRDDVRQEALVGLWIAATGHDPARGAFPPFARVVIRRRLQELARKANTGKHLALTNADRDVDMPAPETEHGQLALVLDALPRLTELERASLADSLNGKPITSRRYDNALQRARRKLREAA
jgi:DNA-directed RNA polymerase specialized sigma24 family protein